MTQRILHRATTLRRRVVRGVRAALDPSDRPPGADELAAQVHDMNVGLNALIGSLRGELHRDVDRLRGETDAARAELQHEVSELRRSIQRVSERLEALESPRPSPDDGPSTRLPR